MAGIDCNLAPVLANASHADSMLCTCDAQHCDLLTCAYPRNASMPSHDWEPMPRHLCVRANKLPKISTLHYNGMSCTCLQVPPRHPSDARPCPSGWRVSLSLKACALQVRPRH